MLQPSSTQTKNPRANTLVAWLIGGEWDTRVDKRESSLSTGNFLVRLWGGTQGLMCLQQGLLVILTDTLLSVITFPLCLSML